MEGNRGGTTRGMDEGLLEVLACPACRSPLEKDGDELRCTASACPAEPRKWPVVKGVPILLDEKGGAFRISDCVRDAGAAEGRGRGSAWRRVASAMLHARPSLSRNFAAAGNYRRMAELLRSRGAARGLVVGCGIEGAGIRELVAAPGIRVVNSDIRMTPTVHVVADAHRLPFRDGVFDFVVVQALLEHVADAWKVASEVSRVLKIEGLVYSEVPLMQPVHGAPFDFWRFTRDGHRMLWDGFGEVASGVCCGPGMAFAHSAQAFASALLPWRPWRILAEYACGWLLWWPKYLDPLLVRSEAGVGAASAYYFLGVRR